MKSGIEILEEISNKLDELNRRCTVIEQNMHLVLSRANKQHAAPKQDLVVNNKPAITSTTPMPTPPAQLQPAESPKPLPKNMAKVIGKIRKEEKAIGGVSVKVFNTQNKVVKQTRTNRAGEWMSFLPPGRYGAEYFLEGVINSNVTFTIGAGDKIIRVAQPQS